MIEFINNLNSDDTKKFGKKACHLAKLCQNDIRIPKGFVISTDINEKNFLYFQDEILDFFERLNSNYVSVRSSMTMEDCKEHSFAGLFDSYIKVTRNRLFKNIINCWKSIKSERVKTYCNFKRIDYDSLRMAVIVQYMTEAEKSSIVFTQNPVNKKNEIVIEAFKGPCKFIVSGKIGPCRYYINKSDFHLETIESKKEISTLDESDINEIKKISLYIENIFNFPQDIELVKERNGKWWVLQSRPITCL